MKSAHSHITEELSLLLEPTRIKETLLVLWNESTKLVKFWKTDDVLLAYSGFLFFFFFLCAFLYFVSMN